ncbi:GxxExxY protein [Verrucomicrobium spinosum]|uniref:GxxExxY protein n=1 Tax=Verrucomicrobium spinosum TaxID=2736 RepID=UPI00017448F4|nr:GxxExxY protein [Verrucomicrobium spinosum]
MSRDYDLAGEVIGCAMRVHRTLGPGFLEIIYRNALCVELKEAGIKYVTEEPIKVRYRGIEVGSYFADVFVEGKLIIELKAIEKLSAAHEVQVVNYLSATGIDDGLLLNFGSRSLEFKKKARINPRA